MPLLAFKLSFVLPLFLSLLLLLQLPDLSFSDQVTSLSTIFSNISCSEKLRSQYDLVISREEIILKFVINKFCGRELATADRVAYYNFMKNGEFGIYDLINDLKAHDSGSCHGISSVLANRSLGIQKRVNEVDLSNWQTRMQNQVYSWTVDFHPSPAACNINIYNEIGVVLHPEVDHQPFCHYSGWCKNRMKLFGLGGFMAGFALDPDHNVLKRDFYEIYKNDSEFNRIDVFMCSHPAANCELFEKFEKPMVIFLTTRLEFGRDDKNIGWRSREMAKWNSWAELDDRQKNWVEFVRKYHASGRLALTANNKYDAEYAYYFTGVRPIYIPSWCGDADGSYGLQAEWKGCVLKHHSEPYKPSSNIILIVPYKQTLWAPNPTTHNFHHEMYIELRQAEKEFEQKYPGVTPPQINHSMHILTNHIPEKLAAFKALIYMPYQTSVMSFFEFYRQNIPIFTPSVKLLIRWELKHKLLSRIYGHPNRHFKDILNSSIPDPNSDSVESLEYWLPFSDQFHFPYVGTFDSFPHLLELIKSANFTQISEQMTSFNLNQRIEILKKWDDVFTKLVPHRDRKAHLSRRHVDILDVVNDFQR